MKTAKLYPLFGIGVALTYAMAGEDDKLYPGGLCQPSSNTDAILRTSSGDMFNASTSSQTWTCPIVRDVNAAGSIEFARITVIKGSAGDVFCTLYSRTSTGAFHDSDSEDTIGDNSGTRSLIFGSGDINAVDSAEAGYYHFRCTIPGTVSGQRSGVGSWRLSQS